MGKGRRNQRNLDYEKVQGGAVEDRDVSRAAKQALGRDQSQRRRGTAGKTVPAPPQRVTRKKAAPPAVRARPEPTPPPIGAALSRIPLVGGVARRMYHLAQSAVGALRFANHLLQVARGKEVDE